MLKIKKITKELEIKQVEFKLGEDCWDMKIKVLLDVQSTAVSKCCSRSKYCSCMENIQSTSKIKD